MPDAIKRRGRYGKTQGRKKPTIKKKPASTDIAEHHEMFPFLTQYLRYLLSVKGFSPRTLENHDRAVRRFIRWCDERSLNHPRNITRPLIERYQKHLFEFRRDNGELLSLCTQNRNLGPLKGFFKWLIKEGVILYNPTSELELPRIPDSLPKYILSVDEVTRVLSLPDIETPYGIRDKAILEVFYNTGIRRSELAKLTIYDVDRHRQTLLIREGKNRKDRLLPLNERALYWIERYRLEARPLMITEPLEAHLFLTDYGEPWIKKRLSDMVKRYILHGGINKPGSCHLFRHAIVMLQAQLHKEKFSLQIP